MRYVNVNEDCFEMFDFYTTLRFIPKLRNNAFRGPVFPLRRLCLRAFFFLSLLSPLPPPPPPPSPPPPPFPSRVDRLIETYLPTSFARVKVSRGGTGNRYLSFCSTRKVAGASTHVIQLRLDRAALSRAENDTSSAVLQSLRDDDNSDNSSFRDHVRRNLELLDSSRGRRQSTLCRGR